MKKIFIAVIAMLTFGSCIIALSPSTHAWAVDDDDVHRIWAPISESNLESDSYTITFDFTGIYLSPFTQYWLYFDDNVATWVFSDPYGFKDSFTSLTDENKHSSVNLKGYNGFNNVSYAIPTLEGSHLKLCFWLEEDFAMLFLDGNDDRQNQFISYMESIFLDNTKFMFSSKQPYEFSSNSGSYNDGYNDGYNSARAEYEAQILELQNHIYALEQSGEASQLQIEALRDEILELQELINELEDQLGGESSQADNDIYVILTWVFGIVAAALLLYLGFRKR